ncbi:hypothetical protein PanWU01x14_000990 [Parasponia andersonii]|uniref:Uncharacterized protein n=1 Tax=Parasponia andersonii TaxID=3476 RepID=A0A2P5E4S9_PARAD|nr:hypothetical protein PanWU01x14_000990 [Parasponia andersonii]
MFHFTLTIVTPRPEQSLHCLSPIKTRSDVETQPADEAPVPTLFYGCYLVDAGEDEFPFCLLFKSTPILIFLYSL